MNARNSSPALEKSRRYIGARVAEFRQTRGWTQVELAKRLHLSQARLSLVEGGEASLTAEQFLEVLRLFNQPSTEFARRPPSDPTLDLQNALARLGARHLRVSEQVLPSDHLHSVQTAVFEAVVSGEPRLLTALAPVLVNHAGTINFAKLSVDLDSLKLRQRLYWVLENTLAAIARLPQTRALRLASSQLERATRFAEGYEPIAAETPDLLEKAAHSKKSEDQVRRVSSKISKRWNVVTSLQPDDFAAALEESHAGS